MSAFSVIYERSNTPVEASVLERVMQRLCHRGPDGSDGCRAGNVAMGHWHFWTTPEEVGEKQPLELEGMPFKIVLDGRLDNRAELMAKLGINEAEGSRLSDATLILRSYGYWGQRCFEHFIGPFALVIFDAQHSELLCARDSLGDRTLFYTFQGTRLVIASEPWAVAGADGAGVELNESAVAHYFALKVPNDGQTLFKNIYELLPAEVMAVNASGERYWRYWQPDPSISLRGRPDEEYAEQFLGLLEKSIRCRLRSTTPIGILMSGGLDSTSVASLAARMLAPNPLTTISYVFDELTDCDERQYIEAVKEQWGTHSIQIPCDDAWPYKDWQNWPRNPNQPEGNPYRLIKERTYKRAQDEGLRVLLTGGFGDHLYSGAEDWLSDLIAGGRLREAEQELRRHIRHVGLRQTLAASYMRRVARRALDTIPGGKRLHCRQTPSPWLTPFAVEHLQRPQQETRPGTVSEQRALLVGLGAATSCSHEIFNTSRYAVELRHPYRDRRLVEFVQALPAYQFYNHGFYKLILRASMKGILPEAIRTRRRPTSLISFFFRGVEREETTLKACFQDPNADWRRFIIADWLSKHWRTVVTPDQDGPRVLVPWLSASYESWYKTFEMNV